MSEVTTNQKTYRFDQLATLINDRVDNPAESGVERYVGLEHLDKDSLRIRRWGEITDVESTKLRFQPGDIIFGKRRVYQRKLAVADFEGICSAHAMVLRARPEVVLPEFLPFFMHSNHFMERALEISVGSLSPTINWKTLAAEKFSLPPIEEQRRLVRALVATSEAINAFVDLNAAWDPVVRSQFGSIIEGDEAAIPSDLLDYVDIGQWTESTLGAVCTLGNGHGFRPKDWADTGMPIIRIQNVRGSTEFNYFAGTPEPKWVVEPGELLFAWAGVPGVSFGPGIWNGPNAVLNQHIYRVTPNSDIERDWLFEILLYLTPLIERRAHGFKSSLLHIRKEEFTSQRILVPPQDQQQHIVRWMKRVRGLHQGTQVRESQLRDCYRCLLSELEGLS